MGVQRHESTENGLDNGDHGGSVLQRRNGETERLQHPLRTLRYSASLRNTVSSVISVSYQAAAPG